MLVHVHMCVLVCACQNTRVVGIEDIPYVHRILREANYLCVIVDICNSNPLCCH